MKARVCRTATAKSRGERRALAEQRKEGEGFDIAASDCRCPPAALPLAPRRRPRLRSCASLLGHNSRRGHCRACEESHREVQLAVADKSGDAQWQNLIRACLKLA
ncbi:uncharacterized protein LOC124650259 isoform X3 [Lolium rigidum]|uniref:uncharacterized protein LOC124650259 isoform X3 n=1 Tax=Lolium rigidum TaxID=89674 RepID=UPI001F5C1129|nr:uncharacterized protein LOC124650259 isoform X3 [Lolium rigidum]